MEDGPPKFLHELQDITVVEGSAAKIDCRLGGFPDPAVTWFKDGQEIKEGVKYRILYEDPDIYAFVIGDIGVEDTGTYTCKAFNKFGEIFDSAKVTIVAGARITKGPANQDAKPGDTISLTAKVSGEPEPHVGWAKDGVNIDGDERVSYDTDGDTTVLTIKNCTKKDAGKYECYVENDHGQDHSFARLVIK